jgi:hypothetical protein
MATMVGLQALRSVLSDARDALSYVRGLGTILATNIANLRGPQYDTAWRAKEQAKLRETAHTEAEAYLTRKDTRGIIGRWLADEKNWSRDTYCRRARFAPTLRLSEFATSEQQVFSAVMSDVLDSLEKTRYELTLPRMDTNELQATFADALTGKSLGLIGAVIREAKVRAADPGATVNDRALVAEFQNRLSELPLPELVEAESLFEELRGVGEWIDDAVRALQTGDDLGQRAERAFQLRKQGARGPFIVVDGILQPATNAAAA